MNNLPNILTILRLSSCPLIIYLFYVSAKPLTILFIFLLFSITDFLDGYIARKGNYKSNFGRIWDPIADKALVLTIIFMIIINKYVSGILILAFYIIIFRELIIFLLREIMKNRNLDLPVSKLSKYKTFAQIMSIIIVLLNEQLHEYNIIKFIGSLEIFAVLFATIISFVTAYQYFLKYINLK